MIYQLQDSKPEIADDAFVAPGSHLIGDFTMAKGSSVWFNVVVRADNSPIYLGVDSNIQDGSVLHSDEGIPLNIGQGVTVGHKVMLHGCEIGDFSLIGINAVVLNKAKIGRYCIVGANALVPEGMEIPDYSLVVGSPAKIIKQVSEKQTSMLEASAQHYRQNAARYRASLKSL